MSRAVALALVLVACATRPAPRAGQPSPTSPPGPVLTQIAPEAQALVDDWARAAGGRDAIRALGTLHGKGTYNKGGVTGTIELWESPRGERREVIEQGFLREVRVFDGTRGWLVDRNGEVRELAGFELDDQLALAFVGSLAPLAVERRPGAVRRDGDRLVLAPSGGNRPQTVSLDPSTRLPTTMVRRDSEKQRTTTLSGYAAVAGVQLPRKIHEDTGNPNEAVDIEWTQLEPAAAPTGAFARPDVRATDAALAQSAVTVPIEVVYGGLIFVKVEINGVPMSMVFDTGAEATVLNASRLSRLGLSSLGKYATGAGGGDVELSYVRGVTTKLGDATVHDQIVAAIQLDALERPLRRPLDGILGYDFISRFVIEIDYANQTMRLHDRATYHHTGAGTRIPITLEDSTPFIDAAIEVPGRDNLPGHFVLDTGCLCDVQLFAPFVDQHRLLEAFPHARQAGYSAGAGGETHELSATIPALHLGSEVIKDPLANFARDAHGAGADPESAGLVGSLTLKRFVLVLDYRGGQVFLDPHP